MHNILRLEVQTALLCMKISLNTDSTLVPGEISLNANEGAEISRFRRKHFHVFLNSGRAPQGAALGPSYCPPQNGTSLRCVD